jgi:hypothetical protein
MISLLVAQFQRQLAEEKSYIRLSNNELFVRVGNHNNNESSTLFLPLRDKSRDEKGLSKL